MRNIILNVKNYTCVPNYTLFIKLHNLCNIKAVSFMYPLRIFTQPAIVMVVTNMKYAIGIYVCSAFAMSCNGCLSCVELLSFVLIAIGSNPQ